MPQSDPGATPGNFGSGYANASQPLRARIPKFETGKPVVSPNNPSGWRGPVTIGWLSDSFHNGGDLQPEADRMFSFFRSRRLTP